MILASCAGKKQQSLAELKNAKWERLDKGIDFISISKTQPQSLPYVRFTILASEGDSTGMLTRSQFQAENILSEKLNHRAPASKMGYLRVDVDEMLTPEKVTLHIYLRDPYDSLNMSKDMAMIKGIEGVDSVYYVSKEMAKNKYLADGNDEWNDILTENPLPASYDVSVDAKSFTSGWFDNFKGKIESELLYISDITYPDVFSRPKTNMIWYFSYERYKS